MRQIVKAIDIEKALADALNIATTPIPADMPPYTPYSAVVASGGSRTQMVVDTHTCDIDTWGDTYGQAMDKSCELIGLLTDLAGRTVNGIVFSHVAIDTLPYIWNDPDRPDLCRVTCSATVTIHAPVVDISD